MLNFFGEESFAFQLFEGLDLFAVSLGGQDDDFTTPSLGLDQISDVTGLPLGEVASARSNPEMRGACHVKIGPCPVAPSPLLWPVSWAERRIFFRGRSRCGLRGLESLLRYDRGWAEGSTLDAELQRMMDTDRRYGSTQLGPQRADLLLLLNRTPAADVLSRGQQKILVSALKIAQGRLLSENLGVDCLYLIDDLPSELDPENRARVFAALLSLNAQLFCDLC